MQVVFVWPGCLARHGQSHACFVRYSQSLKMFLFSLSKTMADMGRKVSWAGTETRKHLNWSLPSWWSGKKFSQVSVKSTAAAPGGLPNHLQCSTRTKHIGSSQAMMTGYLWVTSSQQPSEGISSLLCSNWVVFPDSGSSCSGSDTTLYVWSDALHLYFSSLTEHKYVQLWEKRTLDTD